MSNSKEKVLKIIWRKDRKSNDFLSAKHLYASKFPRARTTALLKF